MIADPVERGRRLAAFHARVTPRLWDDFVASGVLGGAPLDPHARDEFECFMLYACIRGLVAAGGFDRDTALAIDALHEHVLSQWLAEDPDLDRLALRRGRVAERYAEYGAIGQAGGASGAASVTSRLGAAAARHLAGASATDDVAELAGGIHEALAEGAAEAVRIES